MTPLKTSIAAYLWRRHTHIGNTIVYKETDVVTLLNKLGFPSPDWGSITTLRPDQMNEAEQIPTPPMKVTTVSDSDDPNTALGITDERMRELINHIMNCVRVYVDEYGLDPAIWPKVALLVDMCAHCETANEIAMVVSTYSLSLPELREILLEPVEEEGLTESLNRVMKQNPN